MMSWVSSCAIRRVLLLLLILSLYLKPSDCVLVGTRGICNLRGHHMHSPYSIDELGRRLGAGSYGHVYEALTEDGEWTAAKFLDAASVEKDGDIADAMDDFFTEVNLHDRMRHPNIVKCLGLGRVPAELMPEDVYTVEEDQLNPSPPATWTRGVCKTDGGEEWSTEEGPPTLVFLMELVEDAKTLRKVLWDGDADTCMTSRWRNSCALDIAEALAYVHANGVIHFDIKSDNVLVTPEGRCKLGDFGLSVEAKGRTLTGFSRRGNILYMAPEVIVRRTRKTNKVDVYSFSILMWEMLTCQEPYRALRYRQVKEWVPNRRLRPFVHPSWRKGESAAFVKLLERCWMHDYMKRPEFHEVVDELRKMLWPLGPETGVRGAFLHD